MTKQELALIKNALLQVTTARLDKINALPAAPFETSDAFNQKMNNLIQEHKDQQRCISIRRSVAIALIAAIVLSLAACCVIYREEIKGFFVDIKEKRGTLSSQETNNDLKIGIYKPTYIPDGYTFQDSISGSRFSQSTWCNVDETIVLIQSPDIQSSILIDTEDDSYNKSYVNDIPIYYTDKNGTLLLTWRQHNSIFKLNCTDNIPWDEIEKMILSLEMVE